MNETIGSRIPKFRMELGTDMNGSGSPKEVDVQKIVELVEKGVSASWQM